MDRYAFSSDITEPYIDQSGITLYLSGRLARYLDEQNPNKPISAIIAKEFVIDGKRYESVEEYAKKAREEEQRQREAEERKRIEKARREREEAEHRAEEERKEAERRAAEERKKEERDRINGQIYDLSQEMASLKGLFAGMKRKKLQKQIDELNERLRGL